MDVRLPDGTIIKGVPDGMSKADLTAKLKANGYDISKLEQPSAQVAEPTPELTTGQKIYQAARPYVAPLLEAGGAIGGGLLGATAGTFGAGPVGTAAGGVAGAGLGYGIAKEGLEAADVAMGMKAPRQGVTQITEPVKNVLEGATYEAGGRVIGPIVGKAAGKAVDFFNHPQMKAAAIAKNALGGDVDQAVNALRNAPTNASVAEVTAKIENPAWQALIRDSLERSPEGAQYLSKFKTMSEQESRNALAKLAGGSTAAEARGVAETAKKNLNAVTTPMRESSLARANLGKVVANEVSQREANEIATLVGSGQTVDPVRFASQAQGAEKTLQSYGIKPLEGAPLADKIEAISKNKAFAENDLIEGATERVAEGIRKWTGSNGVIDADALEAIRKNAVDAAIAKLRPGADATTQRNAAASVMSKIKPMIDDAIENAGGAGWRNYLTEHTKGMQKIAERKLSGEAARLWKTDKDAFVRLVQNESPEVVEKFLGKGNYNVATELADSTMDVLQQQAQKRITELAVERQATDGQKALTTILNQNMAKFRLPNMLNFWTSASNKVLSELEKAAGPRTMKILSNAAQSPEKAANLLETLPAEDRVKLLNLISDPSKWAPQKAAVRGATLGVKNAFSKDEQTQNAFAQ